MRSSSASGTNRLAAEAFGGESRLHLTVIGCGYVGLVTGVCLAEAGHEVICSDIDSERIAQLQASRMPIFEPHLDRILAAARNSGRISFTADAGEALPGGGADFISVGTPPRAASGGGPPPMRPRARPRPAP